MQQVDRRARFRLFSTDRERIASPVTDDVCGRAALGRTENSRTRFDDVVRAGVRRHDLALQEAMAMLPSCGPFQRLRRAYYRATLHACGPNLEVGQNVVLKFPESLSLGANVFINRGAFITARARITIGDNTVIGPYAIVKSGDHRYADRSTPIREQGHELRPIVIHDDVWIGAHAVILKGVELGRGCVIAANAVVTHDVPSYTIVAGVPARPLKTRSRDPLAD